MSQIVVWEGTIVGENNSQAFESWLRENGFHGEYLEEFITLSDLDEYNIPIEGTGGRNDLLFTVSDDDLPSFALWCLNYGMRWWEDYLTYNQNSVPTHILEKYPYSWTA